MQRCQWLATEHATPGSAQIEKLQNMGRGRRVEVVKPGRPWGWWRMARGGWRRARAQRGTCGRAAVALVQVMVIVASVRVAERR